MSGSRKTVNPFPASAPSDPRGSGVFFAASRPERTKGTLEDMLEGTLLGGRVQYAQFRDGYRTGLEPVLMAASIRARSGETILEAGCGAGAALLCLATRVPGLTGIGFDADRDSLELAARNVARNPQIGDIRFLEARLPEVPRDLRALAPAANGRFHHVMANPPWHDPHGRRSPDPRRSLALNATETTLDDWIGTLANWVLPGGSLTFSLSAGQTDRACNALMERGCGSLELYPFWPRAGQDAKLVLLRAVLGGRGAFRVRAGLTLHEADGSLTVAAQRVLRDGEALPEQTYPGRPALTDLPRPTCFA